jgi:hypothetical protein
MIIIPNFLGGVGNQLFQVAFAYKLAKKYGLDLQIKNITHKTGRQGSPPNKYNTTLFSKIKLLTETFEPTHVINEPSLIFSTIPDDTVRNIVSTNKDIKILINGYFQSDLYFRDIEHDIRNLFTVEGGFIKAIQTMSPSFFETYPELLESNDFCFIGVRRGDYIEYSNFHNPCGMNFYNQGIDITKKQRYYIISDDLEWCRKKFIGPQFYFIDETDDLLKFYIITLFKNYIISNSTFYWWGSYLSIYKNPSIIVPDKWFNIGCDASSIYRKDMTVIERLVETE